MASAPPLLGDIWTDIEGRVRSWNGAAMERKSDMAVKDLVGTSGVVATAQSFAVGTGVTRAGAEERVCTSKGASTSIGGTSETDWLNSTGWDGGKLHRSDNGRNEVCRRKEPSGNPDSQPDGEDCPITQFTANGEGSSKQIAMRAVEGFQGWRLGSRTPGNLSSCIAAVMKPKRGSLPELARTIRRSGCAAIGEHHAPQLWQTILCCLRPGSARKQNCRGLHPGNTSDSEPFSREEQTVPAAAAPLHPPCVPRLLRDSKISHDQPLRNITTGIPMSIPSSPSQGLMPPMRPEDIGKKTLVLDLDETLVHSSFKPIANPDYIIPVEINKRMTDVYVLKRPWVDHFMKKMGQRFEVVVFTASLAKYADPLLDLLDKQCIVRLRLFRNSCYPYEGNYVKDLSVLGRELHNVIIIDNSPHSYVFHPENAVPIGSFIDDVADQELLDLIPYLDAISKVDDVRLVLGNAHADSEQIRCVASKL